MNHLTKEDFEIIYSEIIKELNSGFYPAQSFNECFYIYKSIEQCQELEGDIIEVGVYTGGSASVIIKANKKRKKIYLCDTFEGLMDVDRSYDGNFLTNGYLIYDDFEKLKNKLLNENVEIIKGYFPENASEYLKNKKFSFIHLDVDTYKSTLNSLNFLWDKLVSNGMIILHDYKHDSAIGVKKAIDEFFKNKIEKPIISADSQAIVIKN